MKVERREGNEVVIDYGDSVGVKYSFNANNSIISIKPTFDRILTVAEEQAEAKLARNMLRTYPDALEISRAKDGSIQIMETVDDDRSLLTKFNFRSRKVTRATEDNNIGEEIVSQGVNFTAYAEKQSDKNKLEIAKQADRLLM